MTDERGRERSPRREDGAFGAPSGSDSSKNAGGGEKKERKRKNKWGDAPPEGAAPMADANAPSWVQEIMAPKEQAPARGKGMELPEHLRARNGFSSNGGGAGIELPGGNRMPLNMGLKAGQISLELSIPSSVMGHIIGPKG